MKKEIIIAGKKVGGDASCFIVVDAGANHDRDKDMAFRLIDEAAKAGADAIKFQIYSAETIYSKKVPRHSGYKKPLWDLIKSLELPREWIPELKRRADEKGILFSGTPFDMKAVDELAAAGVGFYKIASFELVDLDMIRYAAGKGKPIIIPTGLATMEEIEDAVRAVEGAGNEELILLQCASVYPSPAHIMNLRAMETIAQAFGTVTGLSDHTTGWHVALAAVARGAKVIEKHFTLDRTREGPDHPFSIQPEELALMVRQVREVESALGDGIKRGPSEEEMEFYTLVRSSLHAARDIAEGAVISEGDLVTKRPGLGVRPKYKPQVVGRRTCRAVEADEWITWDMFA